jgi:ribosome-associated protein
VSYTKIYITMQFPMDLSSEVWFEYVRSRGPGGQHVNKTNSAAILRWHILSSRCFNLNQRSFLVRKLQSFVNAEGILILRSDQFRDQEQNRKACIEKLNQIIEKAFYKPKARLKTKPTKSSIKKRLEGKSNRSDMKKMRQKIKC